MAVQRTYMHNPVLSAMTLLLILSLCLSSCSLGENLRQASPSPVPTAEPTNTETSFPDLVVKNITLDSTYPGSPIDVCAPLTGPFQIDIEIENQGAAAAGPFSVKINDTWQTVQNGLPAGQVTRLLVSENDLKLTVWVDALFQVPESNEINNQVTREIALPTLPASCNPTPTPVISYAPPLTTLEGHTGKVLSVAFSPDGNLVASGSVDDTLRLWRVTEGKLLRTMHGHPFPVLKVKFAPNGAVLITGSTDSILRLWRVSDGQLLQSLKGHAGWITGLDISRDGRLLVSSAEDFTVRVWRMADGDLLQTIDEGMGSISDISISPDETRIAWTEMDGTVRVRSLSGEWLQILKTTSLAATSLAFSPDSNWLVVGYADGTMRVWRNSDGKLLQALKSHTDAVTCLAFSPDGQWLVSGSKDTTLRLWRLDGDKFQTIPVMLFAGHTGAVNSVAFSPRGTLVASGSDDNTIRLWAVPIDYSGK